MYCSKCGKHLPDNANFCSKCGISTKKETVDIDNIVQANSPTVNSFGMEHSNQPKSKSILSMIAFIFSLLTVTFILGVGFALIDLCADKGKKYNHILTYISIIYSLIIFCLIMI